MKTLGKILIALSISALLAIAWGVLMKALLPPPYSAILAGIGGGVIGGLGMSAIFELVRT